MRFPVAAYGVATLLPIPLLGMAATAGGVWVAIVCAYLTVGVVVLDALPKIQIAPAKDGAAEIWAERLSMTLGALHFACLFTAICALGTETLSIAEKVGLFAAVGLYLGQVSAANGHELLHRADPNLSSVGRVIFASVLMGHHAAAHLRVHHRDVATPADPCTARAGESFYRFAPRCWLGTLRSGYRAELEAQRLKRPRFARLTHPYVMDAGVALLCLFFAWLLAGWLGCALYVALAVVVQLQVLLIAYVQHYGLLRTVRPDGSVEPVSASHAWNAPHWFSGLMLLNLPRHSDHHLRPDAAFPHLALPEPDTAPTLPSSLPVMAATALMPGLWRKKMNPVAELWSERARLRRIRQDIA